MSKDTDREKKVEREFRSKKWQINGKEITGEYILGILEEELNYSEEKVKKCISEQLYNSIIEKQKEIAKDVKRKEDKENEKFIKIVTLVAEPYEKYLAKYEYDEEEYNSFDTQFKEYAESDIIEDKAVSQMLEILKQITSEKYFTFRRYLKDKTNERVAYDMLHPIIYRTVLQRLCSFISDYEKVLFETCLVQCNELVDRKEIYNYIYSPTKKKKLLFPHSQKDEIRKSFEKKKREIESENTRGIVDRIFEISFNEYFDFFEKEIFCKEKIWESYYEIYKETNQFIQQCKNDRLEYEINNLGLDKEKTGIDYFFMPENEEVDLFKYNFNIYSFFRCVKRLQSELLPSNAALRYVDKELSGIYGGREAVEENKYKQWRNETLFDRNIYIGMMSEILFDEVKRCYIKKNSRNYLELDGTGGGMIRGKNHEGDWEKISYIWRVPYGNKLGDNYPVRKYFSIPFQIKIQYDTGLNQLAQVGRCKDQTFHSLIDKVEELQKEAYAYEQYVIEKKTCIISTWVLYECTYELMECAKGDVKNITLCVKELAKQIGEIHSLEVRCKIIEKVKEKVVSCIYDKEKSIYSYIMELSKEIELYKEAFNELYDIVFQGLHITFMRDKWKTLFNFQNVRCESFENLKEYVECLKMKKIRNEVSLRKFEDLYDSESKGKYHVWYRMIWKELYAGNKRCDFYN